MNQTLYGNNLNDITKSNLGGILNNEWQVGCGGRENLNVFQDDFNFSCELFLFEREVFLNLQVHHLSDS